MSLPSVQNNDIIEILRGLVETFTMTVCIESREEENGVYTIFTCNTYYLNTCTQFEVNGFLYVITDFKVNEWIKYRPVNNGPEITECFDLDPLQYLVGTPRMQSEQLEQLGSDINRFPFLWVLEPFASSFRGETTEQYLATSTVTMFFFNNANREEWLNLEHRTQVVVPMKGVVDAFLNHCIKSKTFGEFNERIPIIDRIDYGMNSISKGYTSGVLPETLSGVELRVNFPILGTQRCSSINQNCN